MLVYSLSFYLSLFLSIAIHTSPLILSLLSSHNITFLLILLFIVSILYLFQHLQAPSDPDSLANLIVVSQHLQRAPEIVNRYIRYDTLPHCFVFYCTNLLSYLSFTIS